eukprot:scaffold19606_cov84-Isochrysis_galbana.AAC.5
MSCASAASSSFSVTPSRSSRRRLPHARTSARSALAGLNPSAASSPAVSARREAAPAPSPPPSAPELGASVRLGPASPASARPGSAKGLWPGEVKPATRLRILRSLAACRACHEASSRSRSRPARRSARSRSAARLAAARAWCRCHAGTAEAYMGCAKTRACASTSSQMSSSLSTVEAEKDVAARSLYSPSEPIHSAHRGAPDASSFGIGRAHAAGTRGAWARGGGESQRAGDGKGLGEVGGSQPAGNERSCGRLWGGGVCVCAAGRIVAAPWRFVAGAPETAARAPAARSTPGAGVSTSLPG